MKAFQPFVSQLVDVVGTVYDCNELRFLGVEHSKLCSSPTSQHPFLLYSVIVSVTFPPVNSIINYSTICNNINT